MAAPENAVEIFGPFWTDWYYRPLQNLWFLLNRLIFGQLPPGYYFLQIYCHLITVSLVFLIAKSLRLGRWIAFGVATLFAINGQHQLTVGWISSIGNVLGTMFALAAFAAYLGYLQKPNRKRYLPLTILFTLLSLLSNEVGIVLPFFLVGLRLLWPVSIQISRSEKVSAAILVCLTALYIIIQIIRPNANLVVGDDFISSLPGAFTPDQIGQFTSATLSRWLQFSISADTLSGIETVLATSITILVSYIIHFSTDHFDIPSRKPGFKDRPSVGRSTSRVHVSCALEPSTRVIQQQASIWRLGRSMYSNWWVLFLTTRNY